MTHGITQATYLSAVTGLGAPVEVIRNGKKELRWEGDDIEGGGMLAFVAGGGKIKPYVPPTPTEYEYAESVQSLIDNLAASLGYKDGYALASYASSRVTSWSKEANAFIAWRDSVWLYVFSELEKVKAKTRAVPTIEKFLGELPSFIPPQE